MQTDIETIEVDAINADSLVVKAFSTRGVEKESTFAEGKQFHIVDGRIRLNQKVRIAGTRSGETLVSPGYEHVELGIDRRGQGKYREDAAAAGLVYLFVPIVWADREDVRFPRID